MNRYETLNSESSGITVEALATWITAPSTEPIRTPSIIATSEPSWAAGKMSIWTLLPVLSASELFKRLVAFVIHAADRLVVAEPQTGLGGGIGYDGGAGDSGGERKQGYARTVHDSPLIYRI